MLPPALTDGLTEQRGRDPEQVIVEIAEFVSARGAEPCDRIARDLMASFASDAIDDVVIVVLRPRHHRSPGYLLQPQMIPATTFGEVCDSANLLSCGASSCPRRLADTMRM